MLSLLLYLISVGLLCGTSQGQIPIPCAPNVTLPDAVCCPVPRGFTDTCGGPGRGTCRKIQVFRDDVPEVYHRDDRIHWPTHLFSYTCDCEKNFFGVACEGCWFGWEGQNCDQKRTYIRHNINTYTDEEKAIFINVIVHLGKKQSEYLVLYEGADSQSDPLRIPAWFPASIQYYLSSIHRYGSRNSLFKDPTMCEKHGVVDFIHNGASFLTWHRYYIMVWEREARKVARDLYGARADNFTFPYWDWVDKKECEICVNKLVGAAGPTDEWGQRVHPQSLFYNWTEFCSPPFVGTSTPCFACHTRGSFSPIVRRWINTIYPTWKDVDFVLDRNVFFVPDEVERRDECPSFHEALEGFCGRPGTDNKYLYMHNKVHNLVDGSFSSSATSANDPLFLFHHIQIDRIFQHWFELNNPEVTDFPNYESKPGHCRDCNMVGHLPHVTNADVFTDIRNLGYYYADFNFGQKKHWKED